MAAPGSHVLRNQTSRAAMPNLHDALKKRTLARVTERIDLVKSKHKPLSLVRQEAKRIVEQLLDQEAGGMPRMERDRLAEQILAELLGFGPLDELFQNEKVTEFMILSHESIISRDRETWLPLNTKFRDKDQYRATLEKILQHGEAAVPTDAAKSGPSSGFDVKLANGFRVVGVIPPAVLDQPPLAVFTRVAAKVSSGVTTTPPPRSGGTANPPRPPEPPKPAKPIQATPVGIGPPATRAKPAKGWTGTIDYDSAFAAVPSDDEQTAMTLRMTDPFEFYREQLTQKLIPRFAAAGVYDVNTLPMNELSRIIGLYVQEFNVEEKLGLEKSDQDRLTLEILVAMQRN